MKEQLKEMYKSRLSNTVLDSLVRKTYARVFSNDVLRVLYYQQMEAIFRRVLTADSRCVDVGCHEGNVLEQLLLYAPFGRHLAFEPIPDRHRALKAKFPDVEILPYALSDREASTVFHHVKDCDSHSGLRRRDYPGQEHEVEEIPVQTISLDKALGKDNRIALMKIDVEGAELEVLRGAKQTLTRHQPYTIFQHGVGSAEFYQTEPEDVFDCLRECGMQISVMEDWLKSRPTLTRADFSRQFHKRRNYIFLAHPPRGSAA